MEYETTPKAQNIDVQVMTGACRAPFKMESPRMPPNATNQSSGDTKADAVNGSQSNGRSVDQRANLTARRRSMYVRSLYGRSVYTQPGSSDAPLTVDNITESQSKLTLRRSRFAEH